MFCVECGSPIGENTAECPKCGAAAVRRGGEGVRGFQFEEENEARPLDTSSDPLAFGLANLILWVAPAVGLPVSVIGIVISARRRRMVSLSLCTVGVILSLANAIVGLVVGGKWGIALGILLL